MRVIANRGTLIEVALPTAAFVPQSSFLGEGTFGRVHRCGDYAVKELGPLAMANRHVGDFLVEGVRHPCLVSVLGSWCSMWRGGVVMPYVGEENLLSSAQGAGLSCSVALRAAADVGQGLLHLHAQALVHSDVKPDNVQWRPQRAQAMLLDYGSTRLRGAPCSRAGTLVWAAPEAGCRHIALPSLDAWAAGLLSQWLGRILHQPAKWSAVPVLLDEAKQLLTQHEPRLRCLPDACALWEQGRGERMREQLPSVALRLERGLTQSPSFLPAYLTWTDLSPTSASPRRA